jgi:hemerythrin-like domain-containing protein
MDAIAILEQDHRDVERLFAAFDEAREPEEQRAIFVKLADGLTIHIKIEEAHFYPAIRAVDEELVDLAYEQHQQIKQMIADLLDLDPNDDQFAIRVSVLEQEVQQHVGREEGELFPAVQRRCEAEMLDTLGQQMQATRAEIEAEAAGEEAVAEHAPI